MRSPEKCQGLQLVSRPTRLAHTVVLVPIYQRELSADERYALDRSLNQLEGRPVFFIGPRSLDLTWYCSHYPQVPMVAFDDRYFASIKGYNLLMLSTDFYQRFARHEFMLVLQTDAIVLRDDLDHWAGSPYDYVGAPWPKPIEVFVNLDRHGGSNGQRVAAKVGNGGLSLRRIRKCLALLEEFPQALEMFRRTGSSEDIFFAVMGAVSTDFVLPGEMVAAQFALELAPERYHAILGHLPMGVHAWRKHNPDFWLAHLPDAPTQTLTDSSAGVPTPAVAVLKPDVAARAVALS